MEEDKTLTATSDEVAPAPRPNPITRGFYNAAKKRIQDNLTTIATITQEIWKDLNTIREREWYRFDGYATYRVSGVGFCAALGSRMREGQPGTQSVEPRGGRTAGNKSFMKPKRRDAYLNKIRTLFNDGIKNEWCEKNPADRIDNVAETETDPVILTVEQLTDLLNGRPSDLIPFFALKAFAGLRTSEVKKLSWENVDFEYNELRVPKSISKGSKSKNGTARSRYFKPHPTLLAWLAPYRGFTGSVVPLKNLQNRVEEAGERIGGKHWAGWSNHLRHSFCSYHYSAFRDKKATEDIMGHVRSDS